MLMQKTDDKGTIPFIVSSNKSMRFLKFRKYFLERDILRIAYNVFEAEKRVKLGKPIYDITIPISREVYKSIDTSLVENELNNLVTRILFTDISFKLKSADTSKNRVNKGFEFVKNENVCLFSGGIDSYSGIFNVKKEFGEQEALFVAHSDQGRTIGIVDYLCRKVLNPEEINCNTIYAPAINRVNGKKIQGYAQLRGFLYVLSSAIYANLLESKNIIITECGPTMYQIRFSPFDSITMTTHPFVLKTAKTVINALLNRDVNILLPFENMTKSEVISASPKKEFLKHTHSCVVQRLGDHDGTCYGCVIRRIGSIVSGAEDYDVKYWKDVITNSDSNVDNIQNLLRFSHDVLVDYERLPDYSKENIDEYGKKDLFKRFALDTLSALYLKKDRLATQLKPMFDEIVKKIGTETLEKRIQEVRENKIKPDFSKKV